MTPTPHRRRFSRASAALDWRIFRNRNRGACYPDPHPEALHGHHSRLTHARKKAGRGHPFLTLEKTRRHRPPVGIPLFACGGVLCGWHDVPAGKLTQGVPRHRGTGQLPSATRTRSGPQTASHGLPLVCHRPRPKRGTARAPRTTRAAILKTGKATAGAIPSRPRRRARTAKPRHYRPEIHISFSTKVDQAARGRPLVITSDNRCGRLVIKSDNKTAGRHPLPCHDLDHRRIAGISPL